MKQIRVVSSITGMSYLDVRNLLKNDRALIFEGKAIDIKKIKDKLDEVGMDYEIVPEFKYN